MSTVQTTAPIIDSQDANLQVRARYGTREISDSAARTIASLWQSSGNVGHVLATLASGLPVNVEDLLDDIHRTRPEADTELGRKGLDMLATWALNGGDNR